MDIGSLFFTIFSIIAIASAVATIASKNPVTSAIALVTHFFMLAGIYLTLQAQFLAVLQVLVYAGAIMVLVVFVILLLNVGKELKSSSLYTWKTGVAIFLAFMLATQLILVITGTSKWHHKFADNAIKNGQVETVGKALFTDFLLPFEMIALLLLVAVIGALVLAKKNVFDNKPKAS